MNEQETNEEIQKETADGNSEEGNKPKSSKVIEDVRVENERMETNLKKKEELIEREEALYAQKKLSGNIDAGSEPEKPKEETPKEYRQRVEKELAEGKL